MGEYALFNGERVKIGTCEDMYYLRADQAHLVKSVSDSVDPIRDCVGLRFRFPFPNEDEQKPGDFHDYDRGLGVHGIEPPENIDHGCLQFVRSYPHSGGLLLSTPCPESSEGKKSGLRFGYNGYPGKVLITQQKVCNGKLVLVCACGSCGAAWRLEELSEVQPILDALNKEADECCTEVAARIVAGYENPPDWVRRTAAHENPETQSKTSAA